jgi:glycosyltransferase involved in cell wall biosynthesis
MKVLHVISGIDAALGGPTTALRGMTAALAAQGVDVHVASAFSNDQALQDAKWFDGVGVKTTLIGPVSGTLRGYHKSLAPTLHRLISESDAVHIHAIWEPTQITASRSCRQLKKPYCVTPHGMLSSWSMSRRRFQKRLLRWAGVDQMINGARAVNVTTSIELEQTQKVYPKARFELEPYGIDLEEFRNLPRKGFLRSNYPQLVGKKILVHLGRISEQKGLHVLLPAFAKLVNEFDDWRLVMVGPEGGDYEKQIRQQAHSLSVDDRIIWAGPCYGADRVAALVDSDLFVLASHHENFAIAVAEAMAAMKAVVVSNKVMLHPAITQAQAGGVCEQTPDAVAAALRVWMRDADARRAAGERGRELVFREFDWNTIAARWVERYQSWRAEA